MEKKRLRPKFWKAINALLEVMLKVWGYIRGNNQSGSHGLKVTKGKGHMAFRRLFLSSFGCFSLSPCLSVCLSLSLPLPILPVRRPLNLSFHSVPPPPPRLTITVSFCVHTLASLWTLSVSTVCWIGYFYPDLMTSLRCSPWNHLHS